MSRMSIHRAVVQHPSDDSIALPVAGDRQPTLTRCGVADYVFVIVTVAIMLGQNALMASLAPFPSEHSNVTQPQPPLVIVSGHTPRPGPSHDGPGRPSAGKVTSAALPWGSTGRPG